MRKINNTADKTRVDFANGCRSFSNNNSEIPVNAYKNVLFGDKIGPTFLTNDMIESKIITQDDSFASKFITQDDRFASKIITRGDRVESKVVPRDGRFESNPVTRPNSIHTDGQETNSTISDIGRDINELDINETESKYFRKTNSKENALNNVVFENTFHTTKLFAKEKPKTVLRDKTLPVINKGTQMTPFIEDAMDDNSRNLNEKNTYLNKKDEISFSKKSDNFKNDSLTIDSMLNLQHDIPNKSINNKFSDIDQRFLDEVSMEDHFKRFSIWDKVTEAKIESRLTEWLCSLRQIMENTLSDVLQVGYLNI